MRQIRNSERQSFLECRQQWYWAYRNFLEAKRPSSPLELGTMVHYGLEKFQKPGVKRGPHPAKVVEKYYKDWLKAGNDHVYWKDEESGKQVTILELAVEMLTNYVEQYGDDPWMQVISPEMTYQVVYTDAAGRDFEQVGTIDAVILDLRNGRLGFKENKTGASLEPFGAPLSLDEQSGTYWAFAPEFLRAKGILSPDDEVEFVMFDRLKKAFKDQRPKNERGEALNKDGSVSKRQPSPLFRREFVYRSEHDRAILMDRVAMQVREMRLVEKGKLPVYKHPGRHCGFCQFGPKTGMCEVHESGSDWESIRDHEFRQWRPYSAHEIQIERRH